MRPITELKRRLKRKTISELSRDLGVSRQQIYNVLNGRSKPGYKLEMALGLISRLKE